MNQVILLARVVKDYELRTVGEKKTENCSFTVAVDRDYKSADGTRPSDFLNVTCWGQVASFSHRFFQKGARMLLTGSVQSRSYDKDGTKVYVTEIAARTIEFVDLKKSSESTDRPQSNVPSSSAAKVNAYLPPEIDNGLYPAMDDDTTLPFDL